MSLHRYSTLNNSAVSHLFISSSRSHINLSLPHTHTHTHTHTRRCPQVQHTPACISILRKNHFSFSCRLKKKILFHFSDNSECERVFVCISVSVCVQEVKPPDFHYTGRLSVCVFVCVRVCVCVCVLGWLSPHIAEAKQCY